MTDPVVFLRHILESIELIEEYTEEDDLDSFLDDTHTQDAVFRRLEIIGEATKNLPAEFRAANPDIPWKRLAGLRDVLIHQYFVVDIELTWDMIRKQLPALKAQIVALLGSAD